MSKFRKIFLIAFAVVFAAVMFLVACSNDTDETDGENSSTYTEAENSSEDGSSQEETSDTSGGIQITVADVTSTATFYDTTINGLTVEIFAVLASDNTVRVAFNTCQVCNGSKKAYFVQSGKYMVCQNCGSKISVDTVGKSSNSCSPVPITSSNYTKSNGIITVSQSYLESKVSLFKKWKDN